MDQRQRLTQHPASPVKLACVILNWNGYALTRACLESLDAALATNHIRDVIVVDNGSSDDSAERLASDCPAATLVRAPSNRGIAAGYNLGIRAALSRGADFVAVLNNDLLFDVRCFDQWVSSALSSGAGILMPKVLYAGAPDLIWSAGAFTRWMPGNHIMIGYRAKDDGRYDAEREIAFAPSCSLLLSRPCAAQVAFDEHYFFYFDDWDYCVRARKAGFRITFCPGARVLHKVSQSTQESPKGLRWWGVLGQSAARYHRLHVGVWALVPYVAWVCVREIVKRNPQVIGPYVRGVIDGLKHPDRDPKPAWAN